MGTQTDRHVHIFGDQDSEGEQRRQQSDGSEGLFYRRCSGGWVLSLEVTFEQMCESFAKAHYAEKVTVKICKNSTGVPTPLVSMLVLGGRGVSPK